MIGERRAEELWPGERILLERGDRFEEATVASVSHRRSSAWVVVRVVYDDGQDARLSMYGPGTVPLLVAAR